MVLELNRRRGVDTLCFSSPILSTQALRDFSAALDSLSARNVLRPLVLWSVHPTVFLAGADLAEIADLDAESCVPYSHSGRRAIQLLERHPAPTIAAVNGSCSGGGFDLVLACDLVVVGPGASFTHPGIRRGLVTGWSGTTQLPDRLGSAASRSALLQAADVRVASLPDGLVVRLATGDPFEDAIETARHLASPNAIRWRLWRGLKGSGFIDRFDAFVVHKL
jgi:enoyl-CoA hydratase